MALGTCDVKDCQGKTFMGWQPATAAKGRQVCEYHWEAHCDANNPFSLFNAFGFDRPKLTMPLKAGAEPQPKVRRCACGNALQLRRRFCQECARQRERERKAEYQRRRRQAARQETGNAPACDKHVPKCRRCGQPREKGHRYCARCVEQRRRESKRNRQAKWRQKRLSGVGTSVSEKSRFLGPQTAKME